MIFFTDSGKRVIFFDGADFTYTSLESIENADLFEELPYSKEVRNKKLLEIEELKHDDHKVYYIKLSTGDIFEIKHTIHGYGEISQRLFIVKKKGIIGRYTQYESAVLNSFKDAQSITPEDNLG